MAAVALAGQAIPTHPQLSGQDAMRHRRLAKGTLPALRRDTGTAGRVP